MELVNLSGAPAPSKIADTEARLPGNAGAVLAQVASTAVADAAQAQAQAPQTQRKPAMQPPALRQPEGLVSAIPDAWKAGPASWQRANQLFGEGCNAWVPLLHVNSILL